MKLQIVQYLVSFFTFAVCCAFSYFMGYEEGKSKYYPQGYNDGYNTALSIIWDPEAQDVPYGGEINSPAEIDSLIFWLNAE